MKELEAPKNWEDYRTLICQKWVGTVKAILELARVCAEARENLDIDGFNNLQYSVPFGAAKLSMLRGIGSDARLYQSRVVCRLPASYSIIYQAHLLNDEELAEAVKCGLLYPSVKREQIERFRLKRRYTQLRAANSEVYKLDGVEGMEKPVALSAVVEAEAKPVELVVLGELLVPRKFEHLNELHEALMSIVHKFGVESYLAQAARRAPFTNGKRCSIVAYGSR